MEMINGGIDVSDRKSVKITLPEWYQVELQTQKTILKLSGVHELLFYLNNPDEYIRHQAVLRLGQLRSKEILAPLNKIIDDPLEIALNREIAAWVLKSTGLVGNDDYYIGNHYLDRFTGTEKLKDFYYPCFTEENSSPEYHFAASGIEALLSEETLLIRAESQEERVEIPFSLARWSKTWFQSEQNGLRRGLKAMREKTAAMVAGFTHKIKHPETVKKKKPQETRQILSEETKTDQKAMPEFLSEDNQILHEAIPEFVLEENQTRHEARPGFLSEENQILHEAIPEFVLEENQTRQEAMPEFAIEKNLTHHVAKTEFLPEENQTLDESLSAGEKQAYHHERIAVNDAETTESVFRQDERKGNHDAGISVTYAKNKESTTVPYPEKHAPVEAQTKENFQVDQAMKSGYYIKPFQLKICPEEKEKKTKRVKSQIYVRDKSRELSFTEAFKGFALKLGKVIMLPFVILWNQKLVFFTLIVCLYLFFTMVPLGRMLFYRRSPQLAQLNDKAVKTASLWVTDQIAQLKAMASEYQLVRDIQKRVVTENQDQKEQADEPVKYIVTSKVLNLRKEPGTQGDKLLSLEQNMIVEFMNQSTDVSGQPWLYIQAPDGTVGWSCADYLKKLEGGIEAYEGE